MPDYELKIGFIFGYIDVCPNSLIKNIAQELFLPLFFPGVVTCKGYSDL